MTQGLPSAPTPTPPVKPKTPPPKRWAPLWCMSCKKEPDCTGRFPPGAVRLVRSNVPCGSRPGMCRTSAPGGFAFLRKSHGGCDMRPARRQEPPFKSTLSKQQKSISFHPFGVERDTCKGATLWISSLKSLTPQRITGSEANRIQHFLKFFAFEGSTFEPPTHIAARRIIVSSYSFMAVCLLGVICNMSSSRSPALGKCFRTCWRISIQQKVTRLSTSKE